ncbi:MAG TPA: LysM peptidoglycan-binding domain-containing protein [Epsilonproteobacteria bacterium]|nr:LysM peptidoglycan-binding domain-containing protein [Campylobacterota bacterium]
MSRNYLPYLIILFVLTEVSFAKKIVDCRVVTGSTPECNQYGSKLIRAKEVVYDVDRKKLIISKTLPVPKKAKVKIISVSDMIEKYVKIEDSLRFKGSQEEALNVKVIKKLVSEEKVKEKIHNIYPQQETQQHEIVSVPTVKKTHPLPIQKPEKVYGVYSVASGDVLGKIANKFGFSSKELLRLNHLDKKATLHIGQKFKIPLPQKMVDAIADGEYIIESGDTLLSIAHKFKVAPKDLVSINHIKSNTIIREGKKLLLPLPYVLKKIEVEKKRLAAKKKKLEKEKQAKRKAALKKRKLSLKRKVKMIRGFGKHKLRVTATAYSSHRGQTDKTPFLAAWNNRIRPGMKIIAVSRDLLTRYGLRNGSRIRIGGLRGYYTVRDKMNKRFRKRIDIYMGINRRRALRWGRRSVIIYW